MGIEGAKNRRSRTNQLIKRREGFAWFTIDFVEAARDITVRFVFDLGFPDPSPNTSHSAPDI